MTRRWSLEDHILLAYSSGGPSLGMDTGWRHLLLYRMGWGHRTVPSAIALSGES